MSKFVIFRNLVDLFMKFMLIMENLETIEDIEEEKIMISVPKGSHYYCFT